MLNRRAVLIGIVGGLFCLAAFVTSSTTESDGGFRAGRPHGQRRTGETTEPFDQPAEAAEFFRLKRAPAGQYDVPVERYLAAAEHVKHMPQYSTATSTFQKPHTEISPADESTLALGAWTPLGPGNIGGRTRSLLISPTNPSAMYAAGVAGGVWKTTDAGSSWAPLADLLPNIAVASLAMAPTDQNVLYAGTGEGFNNGDAVRGLGILKTTDGGNTWVYLQSTASPDFHYVNDLVVSSISAQRVYAATGTGVWRSTDGGTNWAMIIGDTAGCKDLAIRTDLPTDSLLCGCGFPFFTERVLRYSSASGTWSEVIGPSTVKTGWAG